MIDIDNAAKVINELTMAACEPEQLEPGRIYAYMTASGPKLINLQGDEFLDLPIRKQAAVDVADVASFAQYYAKHADEHSEVFADIDRAEITAVLDAHTAAGARWQAHTVTL